MDESTPLAVRDRTPARAAALQSANGSVTAAPTPAVTASPSLTACEQMGIPNLDRILRAATGHFTQGISPHSTATAWFDWASHFARSPQRQVELAALAADQAMRLATFAVRAFAR